METCYTNLANAIILAAAKDHRRALRRLKKYPWDKDAKSVRKDCERFFRSSWFQTLTSLDGADRKTPPGGVRRMTAKEYLSQAYRLDQRIDSNIAEITRLREMACGISSPSWEEKVQTSRNTDAPFVRCLEKIMDLEKVVNSEIDTLVDLKRQIRTTVDTVANVNERMVLRCRYIHNMTWEQIGGELNADESTIRRWHKAALSAVVLPTDPIRI